MRFGVKFAKVIDGNDIRITSCMHPVTDTEVRVDNRHANQSVAFVGNNEDFYAKSAIGEWTYLLGLELRVGAIRAHDEIQVTERDGSPRLIGPKIVEFRSASKVGFEVAACCNRPNLIGFAKDT